MKSRLTRRGAPLVLVMLTVAANAATASPPGIPAYRDANCNGRMEPYENPRLSPQLRAADLVQRMTLAEKLGAMLHGTVPENGTGTSYDEAAAARLIQTAQVNSFITRLSLPPQQFAEANNRLQAMAAQTRLGIPIMLSTDPRNHFQVVLGASTAGNGFSQWPEALGFAALGDADIVRAFARTAAREYRAVGIHMALSPQADLATEPRWPRATATFGSNPAKAGELAAAYIDGFQGSTTGLTPDGVATVLKHFAGYGAAAQGFDGHNQYGRIVKLDNASFGAHLKPFAKALTARPAGVMPAYPVITGVTWQGKPLEPVAPGFNRTMLRSILRKDLGFGGMVLSDWAITNDCPEGCVAPTAARHEQITDIGMPWGVERLSRPARVAEAINAGVDQLGGMDDPAALSAAVRAKRIPLSRIDDAVRRIMLVKFRLGLFDKPMVDAEKADAIMRDPASLAAADAAQRSAQVLLKNEGGVLPLRQGLRIWSRGLDAQAITASGLVPVTELADADVAIVRSATPHEALHPFHFFGSRQNEGRLDFRAGDSAYEAVLAASSKSLPVVLIVNMDRPAILTDLMGHMKGLVAVFGASDTAVLDVLTGKAAPRGRLPFELPRSMEAVGSQDPAAPDDSKTPLFHTGAGLSLK